MSAAVAGLQAHHYDACVAGGVDHNMGPGAFVRFCKIGALSATGTRPFDAGADGFVMGEGAALFVLKRLSDAEKAGDHVYAVILGIGGSSDGKGKGITAPNPVGQKLAVSRAWENAGVDPGSIGMLEAHGTSTRVGDATELSALDEIFASHGVAPGLHRPGLGEVQHRAPEGRRRSRRDVQGRHEPERQGAPPEPALQRPQPQRRLGRDPVPGEHRPARVDPLRPRPASRRRERVRLRRHQLPRGPRGVRARTAPRPRRRARVRRRRHPRDDHRSGRTRRCPGAPQGPPAWRCRDRRSRRRGRGRPAHRTFRRGRRRPDTRPVGSRPGPCRCGDPRGHRLRRRRRPGEEGRQGRAGVRRQQPGDVEAAALAGRLRRPRAGPEGRVPVHRPGLAVRQHARRAARARSRSSAGSTTRPTGS